MESKLFLLEFPVPKYVAGGNRSTLVHIGKKMFCSVYCKPPK